MNEDKRPKYHTPTRKELQIIVNQKNLVIDDLLLALHRANQTIDQLRKA
jgi:hypothetical protein